MKPIDVKSNKRVYINEHNEKYSKFKVGDRVRISRYKNIFAKGYAPNWSSEIFIVNKINDTVPYTHNLKDLNDEEVIGSFHDRELQKTKFWFADNYKMSNYPPYKSSSNNVKVEVDLTNYATKTDLKNITHVHVRRFASKTNLAALKTEVDKIDTDKLKTAPTDLAKLTNAIENDVVKKTDYNTKVTSIEAQIAGLTKSAVDNLADITKLKAIDTNSFVNKTKLSADINTLDDKINGVDKKIPDISGLATKTSLNNYLETSTFNSEVTEVESKIKDADIIAKSANTKVNTIRSNLTSYATKADVATDITATKNDYVTNASLSSQLNDLKSQHIAIEVTGIDNKTKKNASDILALENKLKQKEDTINENERGLSFNRGFFFYKDQSYLVYNCKMRSFGFGLTSKDINEWKSTGIYNYSSDSNMNAIVDSRGYLPDIKNDGRMHVHLSGNHFQQNKVIIPNNNNAINIYCVYKLDPIASSRDTSFTIQNALFGAMQIIKNATDNSKNNYKGYGTCFDERSQFGHTITENGRTHTTNGRNVLIFGVDMSFSAHATNRANHIYLMGDGLTQGINDTTLYVEKNYWRNFTDPGKKFIISLHYNGDESYFFVNGRQV